MLGITFMSISHCLNWHVITNPFSLCPLTVFTAQSLLSRWDLFPSEINPTWQHVHVWTLNELHQKLEGHPSSPEAPPPAAVCRLRAVLPDRAPRRSCSHKGAYCVTVSLLMKQLSRALYRTPPSRPVPSPTSTSPSWIWQRCLSLFMSWYRCSHVAPRLLKRKRGECLSERESQLRRASVCMCVSLWDSGSGERRDETHTHTHTHILAEASAATCATAASPSSSSEPSSVRLSWSSAFIWADWLNVWMGCLREMLC